MALSRAEELELQALEQEMARQPAAPQRRPGDLYQNMNIQVLAPEEEAELAALEAELGNRNAPVPQASEGIISQIGSVVDQYSGAASARKALDTMVQGGGIRQAASDFVDQYGRNPDLAPTGKEIAERAGLSTENQVIPRNLMAIQDEARAFNRPLQEVPKESEVYSPAGVAGLAIDVAVDPLNLAGLLPFAKVMKGGKEAAKLTGKAVAATDNVVTGGKFVKATEAVADTSQAALEATKKAKVRMTKLFKPDVAPDYEELVTVMEKNGIDTSWVPESIEFGENSVISRYARNKAEGPLGGDDLIKFDRFKNEVSNAADRKVSQIAMSDKIPGKQEAGRLLREGFDEGVDNFFSQMDITYNNINKMAPGLQFDKKSARIVNDKLNAMEQWASGRLGGKNIEKRLNGAKKGKEANKASRELMDALGSNNRALTKTQESQAEEVLRAVSVAREALINSGGDLTQVVNAMRDIGEIAFKSKNSLAEIPSDVRKFQEMYFTLQKGVTESVRSQLGDDIAEQLIKNNSEMSKHFTDRGVLDGVIGNKNMADEQVFDSLITRGNSKQIENLKTILTLGGDETKWNQLRGSYLDSLMSRNADGAINFKTTRQNLNRQRDKLKNIFSVDELAEVDDILKLGDRSGVGVLSTSGTGGSVGMKNIRGTFEDFVVGETMIDSMKKGARARGNYVELPNGQRVKAPAATKEAPRKSGIQALREATPVTRKQAAQGARVESIQERNEKLKGLKALKELR